VDSARSSGSPPDVDCMVSLIGAKMATIKTIIMSKTTDSMDVLSRSAMSLCILNGRITIKLLTIKICLLAQTSSLSNPNRVGKVSLIISI